jgi:hypothetical protein
MNLATLVSSIVLAASTATAGLLTAPLHPAAQDGSGPGLQVGPLCFGSCDAGAADNSTGNETAPPPSGNQTAPPPPPQGNETAPPSDEGTGEPTQTCGVDIDDGGDVEGPASFAWSWEVGAGTRNLTVALQASGLWMPLGGGLHVRLTDGDGNVVATADDDGAGLPFSYSAIGYQGDDSTGLSHGLWHLTAEADGVLGSVWLQVHSAC